MRVIQRKKKKIGHDRVKLGPVTFVILIYYTYCVHLAEIYSKFTVVAAVNTHLFEVGLLDHANPPRGVGPDRVHLRS